MFKLLVTYSVFKLFEKSFVILEREQVYIIVVLLFADFPKNPDPEKYNLVGYKVLRSVEGKY